MRHGIPVVAVREPGAAIGSFTERVRVIRGSKDFGGQPAGASKIRPDG